MKILKKLSSSGFIVGISTVIYIVYFTSASFLRYTNFYTGRFDLGNMDQVIWNTLRGRIFQFTNPDGTNIVSRLSFHADFLLLIISPLYKLWEDPRMLLLIQTVVLAIGAVFVFKIAKQILKDKWLACVFGTIYLLNPAVEHSNLYDFHPVTLATTFFLASWYFFLRGKFWLTILFLVLVGASKEQAWLAVGFFTIFAMWKSKNKIIWAGFSIFSFAFFWFLISYAIPHVRGSQHFALSYYSELGSTPKAILQTIVFSPWKALFLVLQPSKLYYLFQLFLPLGFLSLIFPPYLLFALPDFAANLLSNNSQLYQIYFQYTAIITPFIFIGAIYGIQRLFRTFPKLSPRFIIYYLLLTTAVAVYFYSPLPGSRSANTDMFTKPLVDSAFVDGFLRRIPARYSIAATNTIGSHLSHRQKIYTIPTGLEEADIVVFLFNDAYAQPSPKAQKKMAQDLEKNNKYELVTTDRVFEVFAKKNVNVQFRKIPRRKIQSPFLTFLQGLLPLSKM